MSKENSVVRNTNIELLRIISMFGVIVLHYTGSYGRAIDLANNTSVIYYELIFLRTLASCSVDIYIFISSYFLSMSNRRNYKKIIEFFIQVIMFNAAFFVGASFLGIEQFSVKEFVLFCVPDNYFLVFYAVLYTISPYINRMVSVLTQEEYTRLLLVLTFVFSVWNLGVNLSECILNIEWKGLSTVASHGTDGGQNIVNYVYIYFLAGYISRFKPKMKKEMLILIIAVNMVLLYVWKILEIENSLLQVSGNYDNPFVIVLAGTIFMLFLKLRIYSKFINEIAKATFTCFIFHLPFIRYIGVERIITRGIVAVNLHFLLTIVGFYIISYILFIVYNWLVDRGKYVLKKVVKND